MGDQQTDIHRSIIEACKAGDNKAFHRLYQLYAKAMYNVSIRMTGNREDAEDVLQEAFADAFGKIGGFRYESSFGTWLKSIVIHKCINHLRKKRPDLKFVDEVPAAKEEEELDYGPAALNVERVQEAMRALPEGYRMIFSLYLFEGYDHTEIGQILGISESTSKSQYFRAKKRMKAYLEERS